MTGKIKRRRRAAALLLGAMLLLMLAAADSKYSLQLKEYTVCSDMLPEELDGFRIVQISDLHGSSFGSENSRLIAAVLAEKPDLIALTGDLVTDETDLPAVEALLKGISGAAPAYFVCGNHEWASGCTEKVRALMEEYGVRCLSNEYEALTLGGAQIIVAGAEDPNGRADMPKPDEFIAGLRGEYPEDFALLLGHRNYWVRCYPTLPVQLILSGHAHGGIVRLPVIGGLFNVNHRLFADYDSGLYQSGDYVMEVSRGLGNSILIPRLFNRPELVTIVLKAGEQGQ